MILACFLHVSLALAAPAPAIAADKAPAAAPAEAVTYRCVLKGLNEANWKDVKAALEKIDKIAKVDVLPKSGWVNLSVKDGQTKLFRKDVEDALKAAGLTAITAEKFFALAK
ncbi:MAG: hypothetical protein RL095_1908 [Verrucomicrobiota bacterium]|jgi:copper chaperone CopZ